MTSIGSSAFYGCSGLTSITIGNNVTSIEDSAFSSCSGLTEVYYLAEEVPETDSAAYFYTPIASATLHVLAESIDAYKSTSPWSKFGNIVALTEDEIDGLSPIQTSPEQEEQAFDLNGRKLNKPQKGINIIRYSDGTTRKVLIK